MKILQVLGIIVLIVLSFILFLYLLELIDSVSKYFRAKENKEKTLIREKEDPNFPDPKLDYLERLNATVTILNFINVLIDNEISRMLDTLARLHTKYEVRNLDNDTKKIAENVFNGFIKEDTFLSNRLVLTNEYIMMQITEETVTRLMKATHEYNQSLMK